MSPPPELSVALDVTPLVGPRTGIGHFVAELLAALRGGGGVEVAPYVLSGRAQASGADVPPGTRRLPIPAGFALRLWGVSDRPALDRWLGGAGVVHGTNFVAPPTRRTATVLTVHDCSFVRHPELCSAHVRAYEPVVRRAVRRGAWVHTPTEHVASEVRDLFGTERVRAIAHGVPRLPAYDPGAVDRLTGGAPYVLALGTLEPRKRHVALVEAFARLGADHGDLLLVVAGPDGPARGKVTAAVDRLPPQVGRRVRVVGHVDDATRASLLAGARALAYPSTYEGFGLPVLEAMQLGTPVVAGDAGSVREVAGDAAVVVQSTAGDLAEGIERVLSDTGLRSQLVAAGKSRVEAFDWGRTARSMLDLYREAQDGCQHE